MVRPKQSRLIRQSPEIALYGPQGIPSQPRDEMVLSLDEIEALRLCDWKGLYQKDAAMQMGVSRSTLGRIVETARSKVAEALCMGKSIKIEGGSIIMAEQRTFQCAECSHEWEVPFGAEKPDCCPSCGSTTFSRTGDQAGMGKGQGGRGGGRGAGCSGRGRGGRQAGVDAQPGATSAGRGCGRGGKGRGQGR